MLYEVSNSRRPAIDMTHFSKDSDTHTRSFGSLICTSALLESYLCRFIKNKLYNHAFQISKIATLAWHTFRTTSDTHTSIFRSITFTSASRASSWIWISSAAIYQMNIILPEISTISRCIRIWYTFRKTVSHACTHTFLRVKSSQERVHTEKHLVIRR